MNIVAGAAATFMQQNKETDPAKLIAELEKVRQQLPQDQTLLVTYVSLLGQTGQIDKARQVTRDALAAAHPIGEQALLRLAAASQHFKLGLEDELFGRSEKAHGVTAALTFGRAARDHFAGNTAAGLKAFDLAPAATAPNDKALLPWRMHRAHYLDLTGPAGANPAAAAELTALAADFPDELPVQQMVLDARATQSEPELLRRTIEQVRKLTGDSSIGWKIARERFLLTHPGKRVDPKNKSDDSKNKATTCRRDQAARSGPPGRAGVAPGAPACGARVRGGRPQRQRGIARTGLNLWAMPSRNSAPPPTSAPSPTRSASACPASSSRPGASRSRSRNWRR